MTCLALLGASSLGIKDNNAVSFLAYDTSSPDPRLLHHRAGTKAGPWFHPSIARSVCASRPWSRARRAATFRIRLLVSLGWTEDDGGLNSMECCTQALIDIPTLDEAGGGEATLWQTRLHGDGLTPSLPSGPRSTSTV